MFWIQIILLGGAVVSSIYGAVKNMVLPVAVGVILTAVAVAISLAPK